MKQINKVEIFPQKTGCSANCAGCEFGKTANMPSTNAMTLQALESWMLTQELLNTFRLPRKLNYTHSLQGNIKQPLPFVGTQTNLKAISAGIGSIDLIEEPSKLIAETGQNLSFLLKNLPQKDIREMLQLSCSTNKILLNEQQIDFVGGLVQALRSDYGASLYQQVGVSISNNRASPKTLEKSSGALKKEQRTFETILQGEPEMFFEEYDDGMVRYRSTRPRQVIGRRIVANKKDNAEQTLQQQIHTAQQFMHAFKHALVSLYPDKVLFYHSSKDIKNKILRTTHENYQNHIKQVLTLKNIRKYKLSWGRNPLLEIQQNMVQQNIEKLSKVIT